MLMCNSFRSPHVVDAGFKARFVVSLMLFFVPRLFILQVRHPHLPW